MFYLPFVPYCATYYGEINDYYYKNYHQLGLDVIAAGLPYEGVIVGLLVCTNMSMLRTSLLHIGLIFHNYIGALIATKRCFFLWSMSSVYMQMFPATRPSGCAGTCSWTAVYPKHESASGVVRALHGLPSSRLTQVFRWLLPGCEAFRSYAVQWLSEFYEAVHSIN